ncbi:A/G-specific adenine glycosylase [Paenibacillus lutrae]|uniref:Adenine DNA glycosylase n=1 Tax=Paenibacillus lutrae TaxID=2078573 RepID=A0A7X3FHM5_9BACL|nr:A/G-specific adenine glycosylase [Paenibacillus lutrae]MVO99786.1 A/G-specific adenine glycosylase [Paenibacillus lutrae]
MSKRQQPESGSEHPLEEKPVGAVKRTKAAGSKASRVFTEYPAEQKQFFSTHLLAWYLIHRRDLPWRRSRNPYHIWISEVMLQQTRVDTVIPYFHKFTELFPTVEALATAPEDEVLKAWEGLGYYSRARNLQQAVREVHEQYGGTVPDSKEEFSSLRGVGPYTSGAVLSIAYNKPEPAVDGNVMRVLSRYFLIEDDIAKPAARIGMEKLARDLIPEGAAGDFNQALMELGAMVCTPRSPQCLTCPVMDQCAGRLAGREETLPVKTKAKPPMPERRLVALIEGEGENAGRILIRQRPQEGLLARMWELPHVVLGPSAGGPDAPMAAVSPGTAEPGADEAAAQSAAGDAGTVLAAPGDPGDAAAGGIAPASAARRGRRGAAGSADSPAWGGDARNMALLQSALADEEHVDVLPQEWIADTNHTFSHLYWDMKVYRCRLGGSAGAPAGQLPYRYRWMAPEEMERYAFPNVFLRVLKMYEEEHGPSRP